MTFVSSFDLRFCSVSSNPFSFQLTPLYQYLCPQILDLLLLVSSFWHSMPYQRNWGLLHFRIYGPFHLY